MLRDGTLHEDSGCRPIPLHLADDLWPNDNAHPNSTQYKRKREYRSQDRAPFCATSLGHRTLAALSAKHELLFDLSDNKAYSLAFHSARLFSIGCGWVGSRASGTRRALTPNLQSRRPLEVEATHKTVRPCQAVTVQRKLAL